MVLLRSIFLVSSTSGVGKASTRVVRVTPGPFRS